MSLKYKGLRDQPTMWQKLKRALCNFVPRKYDDEKPDKETTSALNIVCFLVFGTLSFFNQEMLLTAAEDILSGNKVPTAAVLVTFVTPLMAVKIFFPWFIQKIPYWFKILVIMLFMMSGILIIAYADDIRLKMFGIALNAMATGASELVLLSLTAFYPQICISSYVAGTGISSLVAPLYYTGVTTWNCVSPRTAILITAPWSILYLIFYAMLDKEPVHEAAASLQNLNTRVSYEKIKESDGENSDEDEVEHFSKDRAIKKKSTSLGCNEKMNVSWKLVPFIVPLALSFFAEYLVNSSVVTTISFPKSGIAPRDHYQYYSLAYRIGKFVGRSYLFLFSFLVDVSSLLKCRHTWIFALINLLQLMLFLFESWYHFLPGLWLAIVLCSTVGLVSGLIVLHSPHSVASVLAPEELEFGFGLLTVGNAVGGFIAGLVGLAVEPYLRKECVLHFASQKEFCFTRQRNATGWTSNLHC
ncbi:protein BTN1-like [Actinia tenebrosa]|uniref:Battenin n=1 Tax=Actinia tenebrosa TaxID=6105 RepID=A0A6P8HD21_ACTTE|nr:protein BTN1-like [Actinia tenebrosa]